MWMPTHCAKHNRDCKEAEVRGPPFERPEQFTYEDLRVKDIHSIKYKWNLRKQEESLDNSLRTIKVDFHAMSRPSEIIQLTKGTENRKRHI